MVGILLRLAEQDLLRVLRRRETLWNLVGLGAGLIVLFSVQFAAFEGPEVPFLADILRNAAAMLEAALLWILALFFGSRSTRQELESGSWILLTQTPSPVGRILLGKALGVAGVILVFHSFLSLFVVVYTPLANVAPSRAISEYAGVWLFAVGAIPEGMLYGYLAKKRPRMVFLLYPVTLFRLSLPLLLLNLAAKPDPTVPIRLASLIEVFFLSRFNFQYASVAMSDAFSYSWLPAALVLGGQAAGALGIWRVLVRQAR